METDQRFVRITAPNLYECGVHHGKFAKSKIHDYFCRESMKKLFDFVASTGKSSFEALKRDNTAMFPELVTEMEGIASGAEVELDKVWVANLVMELDAILGEDENIETRHCTDVYAFDKEGHLIHGHNDDWEPNVKSLWYIVEYNPTEGADFSWCAGMAYPATLIGWAPTWNAHGLYHTQNTLVPKINRKNGGLGCVFVQRNAISGRTGAKSLEEYIGRLCTGNWCTGASLNVVSLNENEMANIEVWDDSFDVLRISRGTYSHTNFYKRLRNHKNGGFIDRTQNCIRAKRISNLSEPTSFNDVCSILGDTVQLPEDTRTIYSEATLTTLIVSRGILQVWIGTNPKTSDPTYRFVLQQVPSPKL